MRRALRLSAVLGLVWLLAGIPTGTSAQTSSGLGGYSIGATGAASSMLYVDPNSPIPASPTGEMHGAYTLATLETGPSGHGIAAELWPGETASTAAPFIEQTFWDEFEGGFEQNGAQPPATNPNVVPRWPAAAETFEPQGPNEREVPPNSKSTAAGEFVSSQANSTPAGLPGVFAVEGGATSSISTVDDIELDDGRKVKGAVARGAATAEGITFLGGFVSIDEVKSTARVTSDATTARITGRTTVSGLTIGGRPFTIDKDGIHAEGDSQDPLNPVLGQLEQVGKSALADEGITMTLAQPIDTLDGPSGSRTLGGLIVTMDSRRFGQIVSSLPQDMQNQLRSRTSTDHTTTFIFGSLHVAASAAPAFEFDPGAFDFGGGFESPEPAPTSVLPAGAEAPEALPAPDPPTSSAPSPTASSPGTVVPAQPAFAAPVAVDGVSATGAIVAVGLVLAAARALGRWSDRLLSAGAAEEACPLSQ